MQDVAKPSAKKWYNGLRVRVVILLCFAALPLGLIAIVQTKQLAATADRNAELALLAVSDRAVQDVRYVIQRAFGAGEMLGTFSQSLLDAPENCVDVLGEFLSKEPNFSFVGVLPPDGLMTCSSVPQELDFSDYAIFPDLMANPRPNVFMNPAAPASGTAVVVVSIPFSQGGEFAGYISISIPQFRLTEQDARVDLPLAGLVELITFNNDGQILTAEQNLDTANMLLPENLDLKALTNTVAHAFRGTAPDGEDYIFTVVPLTDSAMSVLGIWDSSKYENQFLLNGPVPTGAFPALMWIACVIVAVMALYTLVIRHITSLRLQMAAFAERRELPQAGVGTGAPNEIAEIQSRFVDMTDSILREEAAMEGALREQKVLSKEVHHRVKNNLQMISSIMNMQIRNAKHTETAETLQRVQDRITALADVHKDLYTVQNSGRVNVGALVSRTVQSSIEVGVADVRHFDIRKQINDVWMFPDQVVALSLLASEAITNALKHVSAPEGQKPVIEVSLKEADGTCELIVANSNNGADVAAGTGIGSKLIRAFSIKLGAEPVVTRTDDMYQLSVNFPIAAFEMESQDY